MARRGSGWEVVPFTGHLLPKWAQNEVLEVCAPAEKNRFVSEMDLRKLQTCQRCPLSCAKGMEVCRFLDDRETNQVARDPARFLYGLLRDHDMLKADLRVRDAAVRRLGARVDELQQQARETARLLAEARAELAEARRQVEQIPLLHGGQVLD